MLDFRGLWGWVRLLTKVLRLDDQIFCIDNMWKGYRSVRRLSKFTGCLVFSGQNRSTDQQFSGFRSADKGSRAFGMAKHLLKRLLFKGRQSLCSMHLRLCFHLYQKRKIGSAPAANGCPRTHCGPAGRTFFHGYSFFFYESIITFFFI